MSDYVFAILALFGFVFCVLKGLPMVLYVIWPRPVCHFDKNSDVPINQKKKQPIQELIEKMEVLGFTRLGIKVERQPLWAGNIKEFALGSVKEKSFVSIFVLGDEIIFSFFTPFINGQAVLTASGGFTAITTNELLQSAVASSSPEYVLELHQKQVGVFRSKGFEPYHDYTKDSLIKAYYQYYNIPSIRKRLRLSGLISLVVVIFGCYPLIDLLIRSN